MAFRLGCARLQPGLRYVPARSIPVPDTASPQLQARIAAPYRSPAWNANPETPAKWKALVSRLEAVCVSGPDLLPRDARADVVCASLPSRRGAPPGARPRTSSARGLPIVTRTGDANSCLERFHRPMGQVGLEPTPLGL